MHGVFTALVTPFDKNNKIDWQTFKELLRRQIAAEVDGAIPCGTTGESPTLTIDEKKNLILETLKELKGSGLKVIAGTGSNNTAESVEFSRWASDQGVDGVLVVTPYYNKPSQTGLRDHFLAIADSLTCEVILYNVPGRTVVSLTAQTISELAAHPRIKTIKEASGNVAFTSEIIDAITSAGRTMDILSGDDATFLPLLSVGAVGVISVANNLIPNAMVKIYDDFLGGRPKEALETHKKYYAIFRDLFVESNPVPLKHCMARLGLCEGHVRPPLAPLTKSNSEKLEATLKICGITRGTAK